MNILFWRKKKAPDPTVQKYTQSIPVTDMVGQSIKRSLFQNEKKIKRFIHNKISKSRSLDKPEKMAREIYKWLVNNL